MYSAGIYNTLLADVDAYISSGSDVIAGDPSDSSATTADLRVRAFEKSTLDADAGGLSFAIAYGGGAQGNAGVFTVGASNADTTVDVDSSAYVSGSGTRLYADDEIEVSAKVDGQTAAGYKVDGVAFAGSVGGAKGKGTGLTGALALAGAVTTNFVDFKTSAYISGLSGTWDPDGDQTDDRAVVAGGNVTVKAEDLTKIRTDAGGAAIALAFDGKAALAFGIGFSVAVTHVGDDVDTPTHAVQAYISGTDMTAGGTVLVEATDETYIEAFTIAFAVSAAGFGESAFALGFSGAGAITDSVLKGVVRAKIESSSTITAGAVSVLTNDNTRMYADAGGWAVALAVTLDGGNAAGLSVGIAYAKNTLQSVAEAYISGGSTVTTTGSGAIQVKATSEATNDRDRFSAVVLGGALGAAGSKSTGLLTLGFAGAFAVALNEVDQTTRAYVDGSTADAGGTLTIAAKDASAALADAGGYAISVALAKSSTATVAVSVGAAFSRNFFDGEVSAYARDSRAVGADVEIEAVNTGRITGTKDITSIAAATNIVTKNGHGYETGDRVIYRQGPAISVCRMNRRILSRRSTTTPSTF